jgi:hypothetical protein
MAGPEIVRKSLVISLTFFAVMTIVILACTGCVTKRALIAYGQSQFTKGYLARQNEEKPIIINTDKFEEEMADCKRQLTYFRKRYSTEIKMQTGKDVLNK